MGTLLSAKDRVVLYLKESYFELRKVVWPTRKQAIQHTIMVIIFSAVIAIVLGALDILFSLGIQEVLIPR